MLASVRRVSWSTRSQTIRTLSTKIEKGGAIGTDGRHEVWREGIYDHDNEPK
jgi:hypothetical protein